MKNEKILEMLNNGEFDVLKTMLEDEIYKDSLKKVSGKKERYNAMKKYFKITNNSNNKCITMPCKVEYNNEEYYSFIDGWSAVLTKESTGEIELYNEGKDGNYLKVVSLFDINGESIKIDINNILAQAKSKGFAYKNKNITKEESFKYIVKIKDAYFKIGLLEKAYNIINDGNLPVNVIYTSPKSPLYIETEIGKCIILPILDIENKFEPLIEAEIL